MLFDAHVLVAAGGPAPFVVEIALCFVAASVLTLVCQRARLPSIAGFIVAGLLIGPIGLGLVEERADIETIAGLGLVFLLFLIGLEIDVRALIGSGRVLVVTGLTQVPLSILVALGIFVPSTMLWPDLVQGEHGALYLSLAAAFSSTLLVVKVLHDRLQMDSIDGRLCIGLLVFQDIWAIVALAIQPDLDDPRIAPIAGTLAGVAIVVGVAILASRHVLPAAFRFIAKSPELVVTLALGWCFGLGMLGVGLGPVARSLGSPVEPSVSMELGALVAGASIASFPYAHEVISKVGNLRDFFITLFSSRSG
jgi:Kef-type K+ transport system membrane component KefB